MDRLKQWTGITGIDLDWFSSYFDNWIFFFSVNLPHKLFRLNMEYHKDQSGTCSVILYVILGTDNPSSKHRSVGWLVSPPFGGHSFSPRMLKFGMEVRCVYVCLCSWQLAKKGRASGISQKGTSIPNGFKDLHMVLWRGWSWAKGQMINCSC